MHYYSFNISDWGAGTSHLTPEEEGVYLRLVNFYYDSEKPIPKDTARVFRKLRISDKAEIANEILKEFFNLTDAGFLHPRIKKEIKKYKNNASASRANGKLGGRPRKPRDSEETQEKPTRLLSGTQKEPSQKATNNHKPITNNHKTNGRFTPPSVEEVRVYCLERNNGIDAETFVNHYQTNGWMRGPNKIKDWKSCVITWEKKRKSDAPQQSKGLEI